MDNINIRLAKRSDFDSIYNFIKRYWDGNPLYSVYPEVMKHHHLDGDNLNFVIAEEKSSKKVIGILGFLKYSQEEKFDIGTAVWKTISSERPLLGVEILDYLGKNIDIRICLGCGTKPQALPLVKYLGWHVDYLKHYYRLANKEDYKVAIVNHKEILPINETNSRLELIISINELKEKFDITKYKDKKPYKDYWYIEHRYFNHPIYNYQVYGIYSKKEKYNSIIIMREIEQDNVKILRVVDFIGEVEEIRYLSMSIQELIDTGAYEYVEFYNYGVDTDIMKEAGFIMRKENDSNIIPCYFEPYEQKNIEISIITTDNDNICIFKGDADQDFPRPVNM